MAQCGMPVKFGVPSEDILRHRFEIIGRLRDEIGYDGTKQCLDGSRPSACAELPGVSKRQPVPATPGTPATTISWLPELAALARPPIVEVRLDAIVVRFSLTRDAPACPWDREAAHLRNGFAAVFAVSEAFALSQSASRDRDCVTDSCVDLILHSAFGTPAARHGVLLDRPQL